MFSPRCHHFITPMSPTIHYTAIVFRPNYVVFDDVLVERIKLWWVQVRTGPLLTGHLSFGAPAREPAFDRLPGTLEPTRYGIGTAGINL
jgi:hypothetical protein